jgi:quercetin dioxygenase-like cupin family protein
MKIAPAPMQPVDWSKIEPTEHEGEPGTATWRTQQLGDIRVRVVEYSPGYIANHWCAKGHVVYVLAGEIISEQRSGTKFTLSAGMSYLVGDDSDAHRSYAPNGAKLFIVD